MKTIFTLITCFTISFSYAQYGSTSQYDISAFYSKIDLPYGAIDENGMQADAVYVPTELDAGTYEINVSDSNIGDLVRIDGTDTYIKFSTYFGYVYSQKCLLTVGSGYSGSYLYKIED